MIAWQPVSRHEIAGRGTILAGPYPFDCSPREAIGRRVAVGDETFQVRGVEWTGPEPRPGDAVGLVVKLAEGD